MNMSYRHRSMMVLMIAAVSVFLCSCGIPTYWEPANTSSQPLIRKLPATNENGIKFKVEIIHHPEYSGNNSPKIGLLLLYTYSNSNIPYAEIDSELTKEFNSTYRGSSNSNGLKPLTAENGSPVWEFTVDETDYGVYAFTVPTNLDNRVSAYKYNLDITSASDIDKEFTLKLAENGADGVSLYEKKTMAPIAQYGFGLESFELLSSKNIHVYAAISAQGNGYSNLYWSNLTYVGSFGLDAKSASQTTSMESQSN